MIKVFFIRHGQSTANANPFESLKTDDNWGVGLTIKGINQATELGKSWKYKPYAVYISPYTRTQQTEWNFMSGVNMLDTEYRRFIDSRIRERTIRRHDGLYEEIRGLAKLTPAQQYFYKSNHMESMCEVCDRANNFIDHLASTDYPSNSNILVFTHRHFMEAVQMVMDQKLHNKAKLFRPSDYDKVDRIENCQVLAYVLHNNTSADKYMHEFNSEKSDTLSCTRPDALF